MGLFKIFRKRNHESVIKPDNPAEGHYVNGNDPLRDISLNGARGLDAIYAFLQFDYESRGYNDALTSPEESYKADNIKLFNHDLFILIDKSTTYYEGLLKEVEFHISSRSRAGLIDVVEELKIRKQMLIDHLEKVRILKQEAQTGDGAIQRIGLSYQRGFMRGLSAISQTKVFNKNL